LFVETTHVTEFEYYFACTRKGVSPMFVMSHDKMIFAVLEQCYFSYGFSVSISVIVVIYQLQ